MRRTLLLILVPLALLLAACGGDTSSTPSSDGAGDRVSPAAEMTWGDREPVIYSVVVAEVLDDAGVAPPVVYVVDSICADGGQVDPSELSCSAPIPETARTALTEQLARYAPVEFVASADAAVDEGGNVRDDGLLFWFGPIEERKNGEIRVGANYTSVLSDERAGGVNLAMEAHDGSWVVTGAAGLGGCPA